MNTLADALDVLHEVDPRQAVLDEYLAKIAKAKIAGPSAEKLAITEIHRAIYVELTKLMAGVEWVEPYFNSREPTLDDVQNGYVPFHADWLGGHFKGPHLFAFDVDIQMEMSGGRHSWRQQSTGRRYMNIGDFGEKTMFKQLKDGSFKYNEIAQTLMRLAQRRHAKKVNEEKARYNEIAADRVIKSTKLTRYGCVTLSGSTNDERPIRFKIDTTVSLTEDQATDLIRALQHIGICQVETR